MFQRQGKDIDLYIEKSRDVKVNGNKDQGCCMFQDIQQNIVLYFSLLLLLQKRYKTVQDIVFSLISFNG